MNRAGGKLPLPCEKGAGTDHPTGPRGYQAIAGPNRRRIFEDVEDVFPALLFPPGQVFIGDIGKKTGPAAVTATFAGLGGIFIQRHSLSKASRMSGSQMA